MVNNIAFPGLGLEFNIDRVAFSIGQKPVYWYGIIIGLGFLLALIYALTMCEKKGVKADTVYDSAIYALIFGIIGARIYYVIFDFDSVRGNVLNFFAVWNGGLAIYGGIIGGVISIYLYCRKKKLSFLKLGDLYAPGLMIGQAIGRWGNFFNAEVYGRETDIFCRMSINGGAGVHPLFFYESMWNFIGLIIYIILEKKFKKNDGEGVGFYCIWYGVGRFLLEGMRDSEYILYLTGGVGISQVVSLIVAVLGIVLIYKMRKRAVKSD